MLTASTKKKGTEISALLSCRTLRLSLTGYHILRSDDLSAAALKGTMKVPAHLERDFASLVQLHELLVHGQWTGPGWETEDEVWVFGLWLERVDPLDNVLCDLSDHQGVSIHPRRPLQ
jgi:hypothetical protein